MRVAIIGSRNCKNLALEQIICHIPQQCTQIISGGAAGVDTLAEQAAALRGISFYKILPDYGKYGKKAPLLRNTQMAESADRVVAFWDFESRGTAHMIVECIRLHVPVEIIGLKE